MMGPRKKLRKKNERRERPMEKTYPGRQEAMDVFSSDCFSYDRRGMPGLLNVETDHFVCTVVLNVFQGILGCVFQIRNNHVRKL